MIGVYRKTIQSIPSLVIADHAKENEALPTLTYFHGFTSAKEHNLPLAYNLAAEGYRVILPDSVYHGEREMALSKTEIQMAFWDIVMLNVKELKAIRDTLDEEGLILDGRIGVAGTSMGGITTAAALTQYPWIKASAILMGSPKLKAYAGALIDNLKKTGDLPVTDDVIDNLYQQLTHFDLSEKINTLNGRPLLFWHGESDPVVPFDHAHTFYEQAKQHYTNQENIRFIKEPNRDHKVSRMAVVETVKWFKEHL